jgi:hypothetical protein
MSGKVTDNLGRSSGLIKAVSAGGTSWQSVETGATFTAVAGNGYPVNTTAQACTVTLPASASVGDTIEFTDYARKWGTNALTINPNSLNYQGNTTPQPVYDTNGESICIVYMDATNGWIPINDGAVVKETPQNIDIEYLIVAGGGCGGIGGTGEGQGGGGAGGYRTNFGGAALTLTDGNTYTVTVGTGGTDDKTAGNAAESGGDSSLAGTGIATITSAGGGGGGSRVNGAAGGSGGGAGHNQSGGAGNTPSTSPAQGYAGGTGQSEEGGGGGGSSAVGANATTSYGGAGGAGTANSISGASVTYAGGGGGAGQSGSSSGGGTGGSGGGGNGGLGSAGANATGYGSGGGGASDSNTGGTGSDGIVIIRMADGDYTGTQSGGAVATDVGGSGETTITYTSSGSFLG